MLHLLLGKDWKENRKEIFRRLAEDVAQRKEGRVLIVPELVSHEAERELCRVCGDTASRYAEVLSFTRLARRIAERAGSASWECMDEGGRIVTMAAAAQQMVSKLKAYASVEGKPEFLGELVDAVDEFKRCCITTGDLREASRQAQGSLAQKLEELALLMDAYDGLCSQGKRDPRDQMSWALERLEQMDYAEKHTFYIEGFPDFTRQNLAILEHFIAAGAEVTVSLTCDGVSSGLMAFEKAGATAKELVQRARRAGKEVDVFVIDAPKTPLNRMLSALYQGQLPEEKIPLLQVYRGESVWQECMGAAYEIRRLAEAGTRYRDITLVCSDMTAYTPILKLIFRKMHIPLYQSGTEEILQKSMIATVLTALDAALDGFEQSKVFLYLRSALSPLDRDTCDLVENYGLVWNLRGKEWKSAWTKHPAGLTDRWTEEDAALLQRLNEARDRAIVPLVHMAEGFARAVNLKEQVLALYHFLEEICLEERLLKMAEELDGSGDNRNAQILNQLWEILMSALEQLYDALGNTSWTQERFIRLLKLLLGQYSVGTIPPVLDAVQMGGVSALACHQGRHLILLGAEEGKLPGYSGSAGVLTDQERVELRRLGVPLTGGAEEGIQAEFAEIYGVFCGAEDSVSVYCSGEQPSYLYRRLSEMAGETREIQADFEYAISDREEAGAWLARWDAEDVAKRLELESSYDRTCRSRDYDLGTVTPEHIKKLYGQTLQLSASQIDQFAECRLHYFLQYGLKVRERKPATVDPAEFGSYVHYILEKTASDVMDRGGFQQVSLEDTLAIANGYSRIYAEEHFSQLDSQRAKYLFDRNLREVEMVVQELWEELKDSSFKPCGYEVGFGTKDSQIPAIQIPNRAMNAILRGFVDRVDMWQGLGSAYFRVVDYKTGKKDMKYCDVFNGIGLQMLLYMFTLKNEPSSILKDGVIAAGVQYFPARAEYFTVESLQDEEKIEEDRSERWLRKGMLLRDREVLRAMEPAVPPKRLDYKLKGDTIVGVTAEREEMKLLEGYIFKLLGKMVEDIARGDVTPNPYTRGNDHDACRYCPYGSVCHPDTVEGRRNYKSMSAECFWEEIRKEMENHG